MTLSQSQLRLLSSIGIGVLVGTSLIIIIPEGIEAAASAATAEPAHSHRMRRVARRSPWGYDPEALRLNARDAPTVRVSRPIFFGDELDAAANAEVEDESDVVSLSHIVVSSTSEKSDDDKRQEKAEVPELDHDHEHEHEHDHSEEEEDDHDDHDDHDHDHNHVELPSFEIGISLILGFVLMFLIDRLPKHATEKFQPAPQMQHVSLDDLGGRSGSGAMAGAGSDAASIDEEAEGFLGSMAPSPRRARTLATTLGLVIHAAADGIAMGASSTTSDMQLGFIIFIAIMIHKAPAAFGLTSVLLKQGLSKRAARGHLIVFSLAAPVGALVTWMLITLLGGGNMDGENGKYWTGMLLLFSGGTFL